MSDFLDDKVQEIRDRLKEIEPLVDEYNRLRAAMDALESMPATPAPAAPSRAGQGSRGGGSSAASRRGRRRAGEPTRADRLVELVDGQPGITIAQAAKAMDVVPNGLYQVVAKLGKEGRLRKEGAGLFPTAGQDTAAGEQPEAPADEPQRTEPPQPEESGDDEPRQQPEVDAAA